VDEPTTGLDPRHALDALQRLAGLARQGKLVIASIHDLTAASRFATRILALHEGRLAADGVPAEALSAKLLRDVFAVDAQFGTAAGGTFIDYIDRGPESGKETQK
jgi:iron complex transport system ATP-binding protein